jgi:hypothetical protein
VKILLVGDLAVIHTRRYLDLIQKSGCEVVLLNSGQVTQIDGVCSHRYYSWPKAGRRFTRYVVGPSLAGKLGEFLVRLQLWWLWIIIRPDITHVQWIGEKAWLVAKAGISPLVVTAWGSDLSWTQDANYDPVKLRRKVEVLKRTALLIADSQDMIDIANNLAMSPVPSMLLPIGIDTSLFQPGMKAEALDRRRKLNIPETAKIVLSPRAFRQNYAHDVIVRAFARAIKKKNIEAYLVFKAYDCWDRNYIDKITTIASEYEIRDCIRIIEEMSYQELPIYYAMGDFAVNFPVKDALPVTFLECLACELPVLTKHLPAYNSLGVSPYLRFTDAPTEESLEIGISTMLSSDSCQPDMSRARVYVSTNFDESIVAKSLVQSYHSIANAGAASRRTELIY